MKFSVIVPVYNAEQYLEKCILSVLHQSYSNWELILIDDGSIDSSPKIIDDFAQIDNRIVTIHQNNAGPGTARNNGIGIATGDYVIFLDSDDYIDKEYFSLLAPKAVNSDVVFLDVLQVSTDGKVLKKELMSSYKGWTKDRIIRSQLTGKIPWGGVRKTVRKSLLTDNGILYTNHRVGEEALYSFRVMMAANTVDFLDEKPVYYYVNHIGSQSKSIIEDPWGDIVITIADYLKSNCIYPEFANTINSFAVTAMVVSVDRINIMYDKAEKKEHLKIQMAKFNRMYDFNYGLDIASMRLKAVIFIPFILNGIKWPILFFSNLRKWFFY